ncbi:hypothetical protein [Sphingobacterium mizutaii]|uniref:hypothetical protein n=1 Tax=Sphingobacterium mizutaii TaxID=1010 RepID=UPI00289C1433|nr:hypothetical protein [Sphingobacterium mizutaii]
MERLTIKELAPYLPYGLKVQITENKAITEVLSLDAHRYKGQIRIETALGSWGCSYFKPLLRRLSQLTEEIEHNGERFVPVDVLGWNSYENIIKKGICDSVGYQYMIKLFEWHFDVFSLIDRGLALPIDGKEVKI